MDEKETSPWNRWFSVTELSEQIRQLLEDGFAYVRVRGEVSAPQKPPSGHLYFNLIDSGSRLKAVIWQTTVRRLAVVPRDGDAVLVTGRITLYAPRGEYQLIVDGIKLDGAGLERERMLQLYAKLQAEGLFDSKRKRPLPFLPDCIGVVTSATGAAIHDIVRVLEQRFSGFHLLLAPALVQGTQAAAQIVQALERLNRDGRAQVIICGRGGGSAEDLAAFNTEEVVRAIVNSAIPVVSAVGHEVDQTLADLVADLRAPTPSAAAQYILPVRLELLNRLFAIDQRLTHGVNQGVGRARGQLTALQNRLVHPRRHLEQMRLRCDDLTERLTCACQRLVQKHHEARRGLTDRLVLFAKGSRFMAHHLLLKTVSKRLRMAIRFAFAPHRERVTHLTTRLESASPRAVLQRGYAIIRDKENHILADVKGVKLGESIHVTLARGVLWATVTQTKEDV
ncbi:MAG: exodeoxyribonuclease VII large subunit [Magnetococcus sp. DMHC-6]